MMKTKKIILVLLGIFAITYTSKSQETVTFDAADGLKITANLYEVDSTLPYLLLFHQAGYSKGEYRETAIKMIKLGYNILAVDLRSGGEVNFVNNETAALAKKTGKNNSMLDAKQDIIAAIDWAFYKSNKEVVILGSSYSASLCLLVGQNNPKVKAIVAFSPGEYFKPQIEMKEAIKELSKPVFIACSQREISYVMEMMSLVDANHKTIFSPKTGIGEHGSKSLWKSCKTNKEYWLALMMFFNTLK